MFDVSDHSERNGQLSAEPDPVIAGTDITIRYIGVGDVVYWRVAGQGGGWQAVRISNNGFSVTVRAPVEAEFIDISNRVYPNPSAVTVRVIPDPSPDEDVP